jgi:glycerophosphoryl diester phosphodiesterase
MDEDDGVNHPTPARPARLPIGFAHRGASAQARGNTLDAFRRALDGGAPGLESDAWLTSDGVVVLDHDGVIRSRLRHFPIGGLLRHQLPAHIPTLAELYDSCGSDFELSLDVKDPNAAQPVVDVARAVGSDTLARLWLCSGVGEALAGWRAFCGPASLVLSTRAKVMTDGAAAQATALGTAGIDAVNLRGREWSEPLVATFHRQGLLAFGWDAQRESTLRRLLALGIDAVYCDDVGRMVRALQAHDRRAESGS